MLASVLIAFFVFVYAPPTDRGAWETFKVILWSTASGLALMGLWHLGKAPWLVEHNRDIKGKKDPGWLFGAFGFIIFAGIVLGSGWGLVHLYRTDRFLSATNHDLSAANQQLTYEISRLRSAAPQIHYVTLDPPKESSDSLRLRTIRLVNDLNVFWSKRPAPQQQPVSNPSTDEDRQRNAKWDKYWRDATTAYLNAGFHERILGIFREYRGRGIDTGTLEQAAEQADRLFGSWSNGGYALTDCMRYMTDLCQIRELAYHVDAKDQPIIISFERQ